MSASSADGAGRAELIRAASAAVDPRVGMPARVAAPGPGVLPPAGRTVVIAGHRAAGKTRLLPLLSRLLGREGLDLDHVLEVRSGRALKQWVAEDVAGFRAAERAAFAALPRGVLVAVGGGFLAHHAEVLGEACVVLVPVTLETYRERLMADTSRPRLRPGVSLEEEIASVFAEREAVHARVPHVPLESLLRGLLSGVAP